MNKECHNNNPGEYTSPFAFTPQILSRLIDPKDINLLKNIGGVEEEIITIDVIEGPDKIYEKDSRKHQDFGIKHVSGHENDRPKVCWVEGVAIIVAIIIVVLISSLNNWWKQRQFQKLNAKKEDRNVKVIRDGKESLLSVHEVLVGVILKLEPGDIVSTDGVLVDVRECDAVRKLKYEDCLKELGKNGEHEPFLRSKTDPFIISGSKVLEALQTDPEDTPLQEKLNQLATLFYAKVTTLVGIKAGIVWQIIKVSEKEFEQSLEKSEQRTKESIQKVEKSIKQVMMSIPEGLPLAEHSLLLLQQLVVRVLSA
ncbi:hypothetical protein Glove_203g42 [Diversispora epigaea]|uniref:P-type ATPase A domain-containing protein n=1 Tax=Diversispora epigaea TaxID=1348612 RepID=A0A397IJC6_9GLOM|nr:hypothetical protein Glove_203g42 [Diversispora epigaea]